MKIWLFRWDEPLPFDKTARLRRAGLLAQVLTGRGHQVVWWTTNFNHFAKKQAYPPDAILRYDDNLTIVTLKCLSYKTNTSIIRLFSQSVIARHFLKMSQSFEKPDLLIVHYPSVNLAQAAVRFAREAGIPVIVDVRDMWPDTFIRLVPTHFQFMARLVLNRHFRMKREVFRYATVLLSMSRYLLEWAQNTSRRLTCANDRVFYLGAPSARLNPADVRPAISEWLAANQNKFLCAYVGTFGKSYNLRCIIRAARALKAQGRDDFAFVLAGDGPTFSDIRADAAGLDTILLPGWINASESTAILRQANVALIPVNDTTPDGVMCNKLFDYTAVGRPILSSVDGEMRSFIAENQLGLYYADDQELQLIAALEKLRSDPAGTDAFAVNSRKIFDSLLNADQIYRQYADLAEQIGK